MRFRFDLRSQPEHSTADVAAHIDADPVIDRRRERRIIGSDFDGSWIDGKVSSVGLEICAGRDAGEEAPQVEIASRPAAGIDGIAPNARAEP